MWRRRRYYWIPRTQVVRHSDGRKVVTKRTGPQNWTRTTTRPNGRRTVTTSRSEPGPLGKLIWGGAGVAFVIVGPAMLFGAWSIPVYLLFALGAFMRFQQWANRHKLATARTVGAPSKTPPATSTPSPGPTAATPPNSPPSASPTERNNDLHYEEAYEKTTEDLRQMLSNVTTEESAQSFIEEATKKLNATAAATPEFYIGEFYHRFQKAMRDDAKAEIARCEHETEQFVSAGKRATVDLHTRLAAARAAGDQDLEHSIWREGELTKAENQAAVDALTSRLTAGTWRLRAVDDVGRAFGGRREPSDERPESATTDPDGQPGLTASSGHAPVPEFKSASSSSKVQGGSKLNAGVFEQAIRARFQEASDAGRSHVDIVSGEVHRSVGGYPGNNHRMPICCSVMRQLMKPNDVVVKSPPSGQGAKLKVRYVLPR
jgi:hypothetical protein